MRNRMDTIQENMARLSDEALVRLLREEAQEYEPNALKVAQEELNRRNIDMDDFISRQTPDPLFQNRNYDIRVDGMVPFAEVVHKSFYSLVEKALQLLHPEDKEFLPGYREFFEKLLQMTPTIHNNIILKMEKEKMYTDGPPVYFWHVFGLETESGIRFGLDECRWKDWLGLQVLLEDLEQVGHEFYVANCFYKMTENGFSEEVPEEESSDKKGLEEEASEEKAPMGEEFAEVHVDSF